MCFSSADDYGGAGPGPVLVVHGLRRLYHTVVSSDDVSQLLRQRHHTSVSVGGDGWMDGCRRHVSEDSPMATVHSCRPAGDGATALRQNPGRSLNPGAHWGWNSGLNAVRNRTSINYNTSRPTFYLTKPRRGRRRGKVEKSTVRTIIRVEEEPRRLILTLVQVSWDWLSNNLD